MTTALKAPPVEVLYTYNEMMGILVISSLDNLFISGQCCPHCCAPCSVLQNLLLAGSLDTVVSWSPVGSQADWKRQGRVNREWLYGSWSGNSGCTCELSDNPPVPEQPEIHTQKPPPKRPGTRCEYHRKLHKRCDC